MEERKLRAEKEVMGVAGRGTVGAPSSSTAGSADCSKFVVGMADGEVAVAVRFSLMGGGAASSGEASSVSLDMYESSGQ